MKYLLLLFMLTLTKLVIANDSIESKSIESIITPYVEKWVSKADAGVEFAKEEVPIVIKQYVIFETVKYGLILLVSILIILLVKPFFQNLCTIKSINKPEKTSRHEVYLDFIEVSKNQWLVRDMDNDGNKLGFEVFYDFVIPIICYFISIIIICFNILPFIKLIIAPKLYLVEKFITLVN